MLLGATGPVAVGAAPVGAGLEAGDVGVQPQMIMPTSRRHTEITKILFFILFLHKMLNVLIVKNHYLPLLLFTFVTTYFRHLLEVEKHIYNYTASLRSFRVFVSNIFLRSTALMSILSTELIVSPMSCRPY
jgi:hypothetical protein